MNRNTVFGALVTVAALSYGPMASAELLASAASKAEADTIEVGAAFISSTVTFEATGYVDSDIERQMIPVYVAYGVSDTVDVYAGVAMILKSSFKDSNVGEGDGLGWGGGFRGDLPFGDDFTLRGYAQFLYISEEYTDQSNRTFEGSGWFADLGVLAIHELSDEFNVYAAFEIAPFDDFEVKERTTTIDVERADLLTMRLGAKFNMDTFFIRGEAAFAGEESFTIGAGMNF